MISVTTILALCFAVGCCSTVIQPCGPRMCEQITRMSGANTSTFDSYSLSCTLTGEPAKEDTCDIGSVEHRQTVQMRCVMCTEVPLNTETKRCQDVDGYKVCAIIKDNRSCVFTSKMSAEDHGIKYDNCGKESGLTRQQRQMRCVLLSRLVQTKDLIPEELQWEKHIVPGVKILMQCNTINEATKHASRFCSKALHDDIWYKKDLKFIKDLRKITREIQCKRKNGALMETASMGRNFMFDVLLGLGANITDVDNTTTNTAFHFACMNGHLHIVRTLVDIGCNVEKRGLRNQIPILMVASRGNVKTFDYLLSKGCNVSEVDGKRNSLLHLACQTDYLTFLTAIGRAMGNIDLEGRNRDGETPLLTCAGLKATVEMVKCLHEMGGDMAAVNNINGNTILHEVVARWGSYYKFELVKYVVSQKQVKVDSTNKKGETPLMLAKRLERTDAVEYLEKQLKNQ